MLKEFILGMLLVVTVGVIAISFQLIEPLRTIKRQRMKNLNCAVVNSSAASLLLEYFLLDEVNGRCRLYFEYGGQLRRSVNTTFIGLDGQKPVCMDAGLAPPSGLCIVYSFGLSNVNQSFETIMESYGCDVYLFEPLLQQSQRSVGSKTKHIHHFNFTLGVNVTHQNEQGWKVATLEHIQRYLHHSYREIHYLKLDLGGNEWPVLREWSENPFILSNVKQIGAKLYIPEDLENDESQEDLVHIIRSLEQRGFVRFHFRKSIFTTRPAFDVAWFNANFSQRPSDGWSEKALNADAFLNHRWFPSAL